MIKNEKLLSIIIPTKNRYSTLFEIITFFIRNISERNIEFIIQDNSDDNSEALIFFNELADSRIKYFHTQDKLSIVENTIKSIENSSGEFITFIGDDDFVSPKIMHFVNVMKEKNMDCLIYNPAYFWWGSLNFKKTNHYYQSNAFWNPINQNEVFKEIISNEVLDTFLESGAAFFSSLPKLYHGIIKKEILNKIKDKTGTFLPGSSPDIAFSISISLIIEKYYYVNYPISVFGASNNSGGGFTVSKKHYGKLEDQVHLPKKCIENWSDKIPRIWSEKTIYAQTTIEVLKAFKSIKKFNYKKFYASMIVYEPYLIKYLTPILFKEFGLNIFKYFYFVLIVLKKITGKMFREFKIKTKKQPYDVIIIKDLQEIFNLIK
jgi:glycosyltransferase involved in cell wall biosynthesis